MNDTKKSLEIMIQNLQTQIDGMQRKADQVSDDARDAYHRRIDELQNQKHDAEQQLAALQDASSSAVDDVKSGIQQAWDDVKDSVSGAVSRFR